MRGPGLWLLGALWLQVTAPSTALPPGQQFQVVRPLRLPEPRARRALPSHAGLYPESVSYVLGARGHNFTLHLRKNRDLLGSGYVETYTAANGSQVAEQPPLQDHCFYQGHVEGHPHSAASMSTCAGLRGFFQAGPAAHLIEPLDGAGEAGPHALYEAEQLPPTLGTCGVSDASLEHVLGPRISAALRPRPTHSVTAPQNWPPPRETGYVELYVVVDKAAFQVSGSRAAVRQRVLDVVNHVDKLYRELNLRVVLVGLEIWNDRNRIDVSPDPSATLDNFLAWRARDLVGRHQHDNVQLVTGIDFEGSTVGLARVSTMCSGASGAVNQDHHRHPMGVASTMAHEMGHNLGMDHDQNVQGCYCPVPTEDGGCVMSATLSPKFPRRFSHCSRADLETFVEKSPASCLGNPPDPGRLVGGPVCGNQFLERGEQCDCGTPQECRNPCCNATTCQLAEGAECAQGACCQHCKVKPPGEPCRAARDTCDLEEFCDGQQPACPEDVFQENGKPCPGSYCYEGGCPTLAGRCRDLWGPGARAAAESCYRYSILPGCSGGTSSGGAGRCGVLFCEGGQRPQGRSSCTLTVASDSCQALGLDDAAYEPVPEGTRCGEDKVCWRGQCRDLQVYRRSCSSGCSHHGVCNHKGQCHCQPGWAPPDCAQQLTHTRPASGSFPLGVLVPGLLLATLALSLAGVLIHRKLRRRSPEPKAAVGLSNPLFHAGGSAPSTVAQVPELAPTTHPLQPSQPAASAVAPKRPPPAPPAALSSTPFPVPVYTWQAPNQVVKPTCAPPMPPVKPRPGEAHPGPAQGPAGARGALKPPALRR
ncbi:disintegrin and metalloproteinase domain-containing protein 8 [Talpa occidentalis]|uniref:disintegrin and metalloproteinase domain-containing protein 8 n=1 Tax=Talpa occidentalis TaxID=50954 RepID=UPI0023F8ED49|nr:disintegrin and metalloproteinase domain-containing protein 8 [Talpa occidentalis]